MRTLGRIGEKPRPNSERFLINGKHWARKSELLNMIGRDEDNLRKLSIIGMALMEGNNDKETNNQVL